MNDQDCLLPMIQHLIISSKYENIYKSDLNWVQPGRENITEEKQQAKQASRARCSTTYARYIKKKERDRKKKAKKCR